MLCAPLQVTLTVCPRRGFCVCAGWLILALLPALPQEHREGEAFVVQDLARSVLGLCLAGRQVLRAVNVRDPSQTAFPSICVLT